MATPAVRAAIAASAEHLDPGLPIAVPIREDLDAKVILAHAEDLSERLKDAIYGLFHENMYDVSQNTSMTYQEPSKREELFDPLARYLLLLRSSSTSSETEASPISETLSMPGALPPKSTRGKGKGKSKLVDLGTTEDLLGYCAFRFDTEETLGTMDAEVIYCYEVQTSRTIRRKGLAALLLRRMEDIGAEWGMFKSMLTCLKGNTSALSFYAKQGYQPDEIDPTRMAEEESESEDEEEKDEDDDWEEVGSDGEPLTKGGKVDYVILSKNLQGQ